MHQLKPLNNLNSTRFEIPIILKKVASASRKLAELKGTAKSIPNQNILINTLGMQEAKDSSAIENIVTTQDELFKDDAFPQMFANPAAKEILRYRQALSTGFEQVKKHNLITTNDICEIQSSLECNNAGFRKLPGTSLKNNAGDVIYTPPQNPQDIIKLMKELEAFMNNNELFVADALIKMALIHHQFESIHPFYDGNGRTGRIINVLYLVKENLLDSPILYLSRYIVQNKLDYYRLLQTVRDNDTWEKWVLYMLNAIEKTAEEAIMTINVISKALIETKHKIRANYKFYSQDLINNLFMHPYTKIEFLEKDLGISRLTATKYLDELTQGGFLQKQKIGRVNYYINVTLKHILAKADT